MANAGKITSKITEAQRIVDELIERGMMGAAIAREIGVKSDTIQNIKGRKATGNLQLHRLRILREQMASAAGGGNTTQAGEPSAAPLIEQLPPVADLFTPIQSGPEPSALTLNADEPAPAEPKKLTERAGDWLRAAMLGEPSTLSPQSGMSAPSARKKTSRDAGEQGDLIEQLVPLAALLFVLSGSVLISDPYKPCGPNNDEATAIAYPIVKRAVRELDARRKLSEATTDAIAILLAVSAYGVRAHGTWQAIHAEEVQRVRSNRQPNRQPSGADFVAASGGGPVNAASTPADAGAGRGVSDANAPLPFWRGDARAIRETTRPTRGEPRREPATPEQRHADASIDALLAADHAGRQRLGL